MIQKKQYFNYILIAAAAVWITVGSTVISYADEAVRAVSVTVTSSVEAGGNATVSAETESAKYQVLSCDFKNTQTSWNPGETPYVSISLGAEEGYFFNTISSGTATIKGATYVSSSKSTDKKTLNLTVKLRPVKGTLEDVEDAYWDQAAPLGRAKWQKVDSAAAYELKLYCNDSMVYHVERTNSTTYNFFSRMTEKGYYYFKVRAVAKNESEETYVTAGQWKDSDDQEITARDANEAKTHAGVTEETSQTGKAGPASQAPGWVQDSGGWWYRNEDGTYPVNSWKLVGDKWYLFNMDGYMLTGWQKKNDREYYFTSNGDMVSGWLQYNRIWYYMDVDRGKLTGGWVQLGDAWYYLNPDGSMYTGWIQSKGSWYYLDPQFGQMATDKTVEGCYINPDGIWIP